MHPRKTLIPCLFCLLFKNTPAQHWFTPHTYHIDIQRALTPTQHPQGHAQPDHGVAQNSGSTPVI